MVAVVVVVVVVVVVIVVCLLLLLLVLLIAVAVVIVVACFLLAINQFYVLHLSYFTREDVHLDYEAAYWRLAETFLLWLLSLL